MILAEKITEARKKNGWSQEEMAEKLSVSRQAVSKWESAQSTPDLQKVLRLAEIFGVSTDYLLKDELKSETGTEILEYAAEESSVRSVSMEEANAFMEWRRKTGPTLAGAVALCIISPALLIDLPCRTFRFPYRKHQRKHGNGSRHLRFVVAGCRCCCDFRILQYSRTAV